ncbi:MAG: hypothetical protein ACOVQ7_11860 [Limnoraphis robusta]
MKGLTQLMMIIACGSWIVVEENLAIAKPAFKSDFSIVQNIDNTAELSVSQEGTGVYSLNNRFRGTITSVSVKVNENGETELIFRNNDQQLARFKGQLIRRDPYGIRVNLTESDILDASGVANIQYSSDKSLIYSIFVAGTVENQIFSINFSR